MMGWGKAKSAPVYAFDEAELTGNRDAQLVAQIQRATRTYSAADERAIAQAIEYARRHGLKLPR